MEKIITDKILLNIDSINDRYNPENDPLVNYTDKQLAEMIHDLVNMFQLLEIKFEYLRDRFQETERRH